MHFWTLFGKAKICLSPENSFQLFGERTADDLDKQIIQISNTFWISVLPKKESKFIHLVFGFFRFFRSWTWFEDNNENAAV